MTQIEDASPRNRRLSKPFRKKTVILLAFIAALIAVFLIVSAPHWWEKVSTVRITYRGQPSDSELYRYQDGSLLVALEEVGYTAIYIIKPAKVVGMPNTSNFFRLPGYLYSRSVPPPVIPLNGTEAKMNNFDANLVMGSQHLEFTSLQGGRVRVDW